MRPCLNSPNSNPSRATRAILLDADGLYPPHARAWYMKIWNMGRHRQSRSCLRRGGKCQLTKCAQSGILVEFVPTHPGAKACQMFWRDCVHIDICWNTARRTIRHWWDSEFDWRCRPIFQIRNTGAPAGAERVGWISSINSEFESQETLLDNFQCNPLNIFQRD